jgi:heat-inducible transcriptional repressor
VSAKAEGELQMSKKDIILNSVIEEYLRCNAPIGSSQLKDKLDLDISPSTIRVYFKKLSYEGILMQLHTSSGRVPTWVALKNYWKEQFEEIEEINISSIEELREWVREFDIYCMVRLEDDVKLSEIINVDDRFLLIVFEGKSVVLKYNEKVEKFLNGLIGYDIEKVKEISLNVGLYDLKKKIEQLLADNIILKEKEEILYEMVKSSGYYNNIKNFMDSSLFDRLKNGVYFEELVPQGYMAIKYNTEVDKKEANLFCLGRANKDYKEFIRAIA